jgi:hypothetical protein
VDKAVSLFTENGLKGPTAPRTVHRLVPRPPGIPTVEITEFHAATTASFVLVSYPFRRILSTVLQLLFPAL